MKGLFGKGRKGEKVVFFCPFAAFQSVGNLNIIYCAHLFLNVRMKLYQQQEELSLMLWLYQKVTVKTVATIVEAKSKLLFNPILFLFVLFSNYILIIYFSLLVP